MSEAPRPPPDAPATQSPEAGAAMLRIEALHKFPEVVRALGGDPEALLRAVQVEPASLGKHHAVIAHRTLARLLELAAETLRCPDFGMRLSAAQAGAKILGPLEYVMRNSRSVREAFRYCVEHLRVYSTTVSQLRYEELRVDDGTFLHIEVQLPRMPHQPQTAERSLLITQQNAIAISSGRVRAREVWFTHAALSPPEVYRRYFSAEPRFAQSMNGLLFADADLDVPVPDIDPQVYELATHYIEQRFPVSDAALSTHLRAVVERLLLGGDCTHNSVAAALGMHPRTLQRRLKTENQSFEAIRDSVRREVALRSLKESELPLIQIAQMLGYSDTSALSRSCLRWFGVTPRQLRGGGEN